MLTSPISQDLPKTLPANLSVFPLLKRLLRISQIDSYLHAICNMKQPLSSFCMWFEDRLCVQRMRDMFVDLPDNTGIMGWSCEHAVCGQYFQMPEVLVQKNFGTLTEDSASQQFEFCNIEERKVQNHFLFVFWMVQILWLFKFSVSLCDRCEYCLPGPGSGRKRTTKHC